MNRKISYFRTLYRSQRGFVDSPRFLTFTVTFRCNARCVMCDSWRKEPDNELTLEQIEKIFDQLPSMDAVRLTGGEPFLRKDLLEITQLAQEKLCPSVLHVTTNGMATDRIVRYCEERRKSTRLYILVSVDGMEDKHNAIRGYPNAWERAVETIRELAPRQGELKIKLSVNQTVVDAEGADHYEHMCRFFDDLDIPVHVVVAYEDSAAYSVEQEVDMAPREAGQFTPFGTFTHSQLQKLIATLTGSLRRHAFFERLGKRYYLWGIQNRLLGKGSQPNPKCVALNAHMRLFPDGQVPTCQFNTKSVGNLSTQSFEDVWYGASAKKQRSWVKRCPGCWAECEILPSAIYTGDLIKYMAIPGFVYPRSSPRSLGVLPKIDSS